MEEKIFFNKNGVIVGNSRFVARGKTHDMSEVLSITEYDIIQSRANRYMGYLLVIIMLSFGIYGFVFVIPEIPRYELISFYSVVTIIGLLIYIRTPKDTYKIFLNTPSGSIMALASKNKEYNRIIVNALNDAIASRDDKKDKEDKKDIVNSEIKTDKPVEKIEDNRQDIRDAMMGKNGKMTLMPGVLIDTITMREIPMHNNPTNFTTIRGIATGIEYFFSGRGGRMPVKTSRGANLIQLNIGKKNVYIPGSSAPLCTDDRLPTISYGDDIEAMCAPCSPKGLPNVLVLKNHTSGVLWYVHTRIF